MPYDLWYWTGVEGRGEFVRLALEAAGIAYRDRARDDDAGENALIDDMRTPREHPPFAPPYLVADGMVIGQTANILLFLGERHGLAPSGIAARLWVHQLQLTLADLVVETHDVHHPIAADLYYEDQQAEAQRRAESFRGERIPKFLGYFERVLAGPGEWLTGDGRWTYADLSLFQVMDGLLFAFPKRLGRIAKDYPKVMALHERVAQLPDLAEYFASDRRLPFGEGIFRHYPELDSA